jgi:hypothetical protein
VGTFSVEGKKYEIVIASDVSSRDGIGAELWHLDRNEMLVEIFRDDTSRRMTFFVAKQIEVSLEVLDALLRAFEEIPGRTFIDYDSLEQSNLD